MRATALTILVMTSALCAQESRPTSRPTWADGWSVDFEATEANAKREGRDMLVHFCASDWSHACRRLREDVLDRTDFVEDASRTYGLELCVLDFPQTEARQAQVPDIAKNREIATRLEVGKFPTLLVISPRGDVLVRLEEAPLDADSLLTQIDDARRAARVLFAEIRELEATVIDSDDPIDAYRRAIDMLSRLERGHPGARRLAAIATYALDLEPDSHPLRIRALRTLLDSGENDAAIRQLAIDVDPRNERGLLEHAIAAEFDLVQTRDESFAALTSLDRLLELEIVDEERGRKLFTNGARWADRKNAAEEIRKKAAVYARKALELGIENQEVAKYLTGVVRRNR